MNQEQAEMNVLFKYYKNLPNSYFDDPTLKISSTTQLNDPFEEIIDDESMSLALDKYEDSDPVSIFCKRDENLLSVFNEVSFSSMIENIGIISLTETPRNLLMWSHYADQHKGICIGYKSNLLDHMADRSHPSLPVAFKPQKINYDNCRYDRYTDIFNGMDMIELRKNIVMKSLLTKGDDWIYEKEHRCIIPLQLHEEIKCMGDNNSSHYKNELEDVIVIDEKTFKVEPDVHSTFENNYAMFCDDLMFTLKIAPSSIVSIYVGWKSNHAKNMELYDKISNDDRLSHIKMYQVMPSRTKFELNIMPFSDLNN